MLFAYRRAQHAVNIPELAIASLLAKKLSVGVTEAGLEVRVASHGNFGASWEEAKSNAIRFNRVAASLGIKSVCFLTNAETPYQPGIGRGEALLAIAEILENPTDPSLVQHARMCFAMAKRVAGDTQASMPRPEELLPFFASHLEAQGSSLNAFHQAVKLIRGQPRHEWRASRTGFLLINLGRLRDAIVQIQDIVGYAHNPYPDPAGIFLVCGAFRHVLADEVIAIARCDEHHWDRFSNLLPQAFLISDSPGSNAGFEEVFNA